MFQTLVPQDHNTSTSPLASHQPLPLFLLSYQNCSPNVPCHPSALHLCIYCPSSQLPTPSSAGFDSPSLLPHNEVDVPPPAGSLPGFSVLSEPLCRDSSHCASFLPALFLPKTESSLRAGVNQPQGPVPACKGKGRLSLLCLLGNQVYKLPSGKWHCLLLCDLGQSQNRLFTTTPLWTLEVLSDLCSSQRTRGRWALPDHSRGGWLTGFQRLAREARTSISEAEQTWVQILQQFLAPPL